MSETVPSSLLPEFVGFIESARAGHVAFPCCRSCGKFHWYPMPRCPHCRGRDIEWRRVSGEAKIFSFTRVMHPFDRSRADWSYVVALVTFADAPGVRLVTNIVGDKLDELRIGQTVMPKFGTEWNGLSIVQFESA